MNKVMLIGYVGKDPEVQYVDSDTPVARLSLATSERGYTPCPTALKCRNAPIGIPSFYGESWPRPLRSMSTRATTSISRADSVILPITTKRA